MFSDYITGRGRVLWVEDIPVEDLASEFGTPLYILSENQIRYNYRRFRDAFQRHYVRARVMYAIKANNNLAVRRILSDEGAGGECFGLGEMWATLAGGTPPDQTVLNGSNKSRAELEFAVDAGVTVNVDNLVELQQLLDVAQARSRPVTIALRMKPRIEALFGVPLGDSGLSLGDRILGVKWGMPPAELVEAVRIAQGSPWLKLVGFSFHMGRHTVDPAHFGTACHGVLACVAEVREHTGFEPAVLDLGGGYPHGRDPEGAGRTAGARPIEEYAEAVTTALRDGLNHFGLPEVLLELEPGRHLVGNAGLLLTRVGVIKRLAGFRPWVHVDASTNHLLRHEIAGYHYQAIAAGALDQEAVEAVQLVGPNCTPDVFDPAVPMPLLSNGDLVAFLDAGMYAETVANQFNGMPRPATVLVAGGDVAVIRRREGIQQVFQQQEVPAWLFACRSRKRG